MTLAQLKQRGFDNCRKIGRQIIVGCRRCAAAVINGVPCHETGCPNVGRDVRHGMEGR